MFGFDKKMIYIVAAVLLVMAIFSSGTDGLLILLLTLPGVIIAITFHEYAHAFAAYKLGDDTPRLQGRLNLNPLSHLDILGFIMLIVAHFGWGKPVQINPRNFNGKYSLSASEAIVAAAGPIMNFILSIFFALILGVVANYAPTAFLTTTAGEYLAIIIQYTIIVNIGLGVFNLIPLPPLDGSKILMHFLPYNAREVMVRNEGIFMIAFIIIWVSGIGSAFISPIMTFLYTTLMTGVGMLF